MNVEKPPSANSAGGSATAAPDNGNVDEADRQAFDATHAGQQREGAEPAGRSAPSLTTLPPELRGQIMQDTMTAAPDPRSQAAAFRDADNLSKVSRSYSSLVADPSGGLGKQFREMRSSTNAQRAREDFRGHVNDLNAITDKGERQQKIQTIHDAAIREYRNPDASLSSIESARLGDRAAEKANYSNDLGPLDRLRQSPTANAAKRALDNTSRTPNASMTGHVLLSDPRTTHLTLNRGKPVKYEQVYEHMNGDPNFSHTRFLAGTARPRQGVSPEWQQSHAYRSTNTRQAIREFTNSPAHGSLSRDTDGRESS